MSKPVVCRPGLSGKEQRDLFKRRGKHLLGVTRLLLRLLSVALWIAGGLRRKCSLRNCELEFLSTGTTLAIAENHGTVIFRHASTPTCWKTSLWVSSRSGVRWAACSARAVRGASGSPTLAPGTSLVKLHPAASPRGLAKGSSPFLQHLTHPLSRPASCASGEGSRVPCGALGCCPAK